MKTAKRIAAWLLVLIMLPGLLAGCGSGAETAAAADAVVREATGVNYVERMGIGFSLDVGSTLRQNDRIETKESSSAELALGGTTVMLSEETEIRLVSPEENAGIELNMGELFLRSAPGAVSTLTLFDRTVTLSGTALVWVRTGSAGILVLSGTAEEENETLAAGDCVSYTETSAERSRPKAASLDEFALTCAAAAAADGETLCYSAEDIHAAVSAHGHGETAVENWAGPVCTIEIRCDTILDNMENLTGGKNAYVPADGTILAALQIGFTEGETVFSVLQRACDAAGIALEYSWTPLYNSYYIEGINNLYEFDCGEQSGWMYKVNGLFPNCGSSSYTLEDGDIIVWCYTCSGLGADVGGSVC